jgi:hypothetical protein
VPGRASPIPCSAGPGAPTAVSARERQKRETEGHTDKETERQSRRRPFPRAAHLARHVRPPARLRSQRPLAARDHHRGREACATRTRWRTVEAAAAAQVPLLECRCCRHHRRRHPLLLLEGGGRTAVEAGGERAGRDDEDRAVAGSELGDLHSAPAVSPESWVWGTFIENPMAGRSI